MPKKILGPKTPLFLQSSGFSPPMPFRPEPFLAIFCQKRAKNGQNRLLASIAIKKIAIEARPPANAGVPPCWRPKGGVPPLLGPFLGQKRPKNGLKPGFLGKKGLKAGFPPHLEHFLGLVDTGGAEAQIRPEKPLTAIFLARIFDQRPPIRTNSFYENWFS